VARKYLIETFGCQMNFHDSERMAGLLEQAGFESTDDASDADLFNSVFGWTDSAFPHASVVMLPSVRFFPNN